MRTLHLTWNAFLVGAKATFSLVKRVAEMYNPSLHLLNGKDYDSAVTDAIIFHAASALGQLDPTLRPRFHLHTYNDIEQSGCEVTVTSANTIDIATGLVRETAKSSEELTREDKVLVLNMLHKSARIASGSLITEGRVHAMYSSISDLI